MKVLVVDDDPAILRTFVRAFRRYLAITTLSDPFAAEATFAADDYDVVFLDYSMPGRNGLEVLSGLKRAHPDAVCVMLTAHADVADLKRASDEGQLAALMRKPWDRHQLVSVVKSLVTGRAAP